jgi:NitT/TauT family transport system permease protein
MATTVAKPARAGQARGRPRPARVPALRLLSYQVAFAVAVFGFWQFASGRLIDAFWISSPAAIVAYLWDGLISGTLISNGVVTFWEAGLGFVIGAIAGIATGLLLAVAETPRRVLDPYFMSVYGMPRIALAPLFIIWFGIGTLSKVVLVVMIVFLLVFYSTYEGVVNVPAELKRLVRVLGAAEWQVWTKVILPSASPWIITGLKISVPQALVGAVVGEFIASTEGLGFLIQYHSGLFDTTGVLGGIAIMAAAVVVINSLLDRLERHLMRWRPRESASVAAEP